MSKLSKECIEAIKETNEYKMCGASGASYTQKHFMQGATEALTNPTIYQSAGLIKAQDILPETFKTEAVNTILVNALRYLNDEQTTHLLKAICQRKKDAALEAGLMSVEEALRFAEWVGLRFEMYGQKEWYGTLGGTYTTTELLNIFRNKNQEK